MAPKRGQSIEKTTEHEEFMKELQEYHEKRGYVMHYHVNAGTPC